MNAVTDIKAQHASIAMALATAQSNMGKALKSANNPHFKSKYADLASVVDACMPALNDCGIAVIQPTTDDENGRYVETILIHGESGQQLSCRVPLIVSKQDMQGYGSAVTYARRYGLMSMAGIAPEDDDGQAAMKSPPKPTVTECQGPRIIKLINEAQHESQLDDIKADEKAAINGLSNGAFETVKAAFGVAKKKLSPPVGQEILDDDSIPYMEDAK